MAEGPDVNPFEVSTLPEDTIDETFPLIDRSTDREINSGGEKETSFTSGNTNLKNEVYEELVHSFYKRFHSFLPDEESYKINSDLLVMRDRELYYDDDEDPGNKE